MSCNANPLTGFGAFEPTVSTPGAGAVTKDYLALLKGFEQGLPMELQGQQTYGPQFEQLDLNALTDALPTILGIDTTTRTANLNDLTNLGPGYVSAIKASNPGQTALTDQLTKTATDQLKLGSTIDPDTSSKITSAVRTNWANRGLGDSMPAGLDEALQLFGGGQNLLNQRESAAGQAATLNANLYEDPLLSLFGSNAGAPAMAAGVAGGSTNLVSPSDLESLFSGVYSAKNAANTANANIDASLCGSSIGALGSVADGALACWAAREIFGAHDGKWMQFRQWVLTKAPEKFRKFYLRHGREWAERLRSASVGTRIAVRHWMERRLIPLTPLLEIEPKRSQKILP